MALILGIDVGTQSVKTGIFDTDTCGLANIASRPYYSGSRQVAHEILDGCLDAIAESISRHGGANDIAGIGFSGQMHGTVMFDENGNLIEDIINRQDESCNEPVGAYGGQTTIEHMIELMQGNDLSDLGIDKMSSGFMGATLFYLKEQEPELFKQVKHVLFPTDYIRRELLDGGAFETDPTNGFSAGVFNTRENTWHEGVIRSLGLPLGIFPKVRDTHDVCGAIGAKIAARTGLKIGTPVIVGGGDNQMSMIGSGAFAPGGPLVLNIGTSSQLCAVVSEYKKIDGIDTRSFIGGAFALVYPGLTGGKCYTWLRNTLRDDIAAAGCSQRENFSLYEIINELAADIPAGCDGLRFTPTLRGTRLNPALRGAFTGIGEDNFSLGHRARAVMEGVVDELLSSYNLMSSASTDTIVGAGNGLVQSSLWRGIASDMFGMTLKIADMENAVCGAAIVAAVGLGLMKYEDVNIEFSHIITPDARRSKE